MTRKIFALLMVLVLFVLVSPIIGKADFGNFAGDYDYDYGGSSSGGGYSYDYGNYNSYSSRGNSGYYSYGGSSGGSNSGDNIGIMVLAILAAPLICLIYAMRSDENDTPASRRTPVRPPFRPQQTQPLELLPMSGYSKLDENFDEQEICEKLANLYIQMQNEWTNRDIEPLRPYFTHTFFAQCETQVNQLKQLGRINYVERIAILGTELLGYKQVGGKDIITARLKTRIVDYTVNENTGEVISGSKTAEKFMTYEWDLSRTSGAKTTKNDGVAKMLCPSCGAPLDTSASAKCKFCGSVINHDEHTWAICAIRGISQRTVEK